MAKVAVIGAGSWGTALAKVLHTNGNQVTVWSIVEAEIAMLRERHEHVDKLPGVKLPEDMEFTTDLKAAVEDKEYLILAVPSVFTRSTAKSMAPFVKAGQIVVCVARPMATRCLCPPERAFGLRSNNFSRSRIFAASSTFLLISSFGTFLNLRPNAMLSNTVICGYRA